MIYFIIFALCAIAVVIAPIVNNYINPYVSEKIYYTTMGVLFVMVFIFGGLTFNYGCSEQKERVKVYYNLSDEEIKNYTQKTIGILYEKIPELEAEKAIQRNKEKIIR